MVKPYRPRRFAGGKKQQQRQTGGAHHNNNGAMNDAPVVAAANGNGANGNANGDAPKQFLHFPPETNSIWPTQLAEAATHSYRLVKRHWRAEMPHLFAVFAIIFALYAYTSPRFVTLEDDGLFIANMRFFGVAHPPGLHTFLGGFYHILDIFGLPPYQRLCRRRVFVLRKMARAFFCAAGTTGASALIVICAPPVCRCCCFFPAKRAGMV